MTRKQLPRAIMPRSSELLQTVVGAVADEATPEARRALPRDAVEPEPALAISSAAPANDTFAATPSPLQKLAVRRRVLAGRIVERHGTLAAVSGLTPLPIISIAGVAVVIMRMVKQLCGLYQVPFERDRTRSIIVGVLAGAAPTGLGAATTSTLGLFVAPGSALIGIAVAALSAGALTRAIGQVFIESFERDAMPAGVAESKRP